jgi:hypothetical protein
MLLTEVPRRVGLSSTSEPRCRRAGEASVVFGPSHKWRLDQGVLGAVPPRGAWPPPHGYSCVFPIQTGCTVPETVVSMQKVPNLTPSFQKKGAGRFLVAATRVPLCMASLSLGRPTCDLVMAIPI